MYHPASLQVPSLSGHMQLPLNVHCPQYPVHSELTLDRLKANTMDSLRFLQNASMLSRFAPEHRFNPQDVQMNPYGFSTLSYPYFKYFASEPKPTQSYIGLIAMAILSVKDKKLVLSDIYQWILDNFAYFRTRGPGWRNSIRHNLSLNDCFLKSGRSPNGKGHFWAVHPACMEDFEKGDYRRRKAQRKVRSCNGENSERDTTEDTEKKTFSENGDDSERIDLLTVDDEDETCAEQFDDIKEWKNERTSGETPQTPCKDPPGDSHDDRNVNSPCEVKAAVKRPFDMDSILSRDYTSSLSRSAKHKCVWAERYSTE